MKYFVKNCNNKTIILIDEFGSGTEPQIGGAIAEALLDRFNRNQSFGVITTHYQNLKHFAEDTAGIVNGAMLYDRHLMQPLFKLSIGNPGSSFAVEIARKIGLPEDVIADASAKVGADYINMYSTPNVVLPSLSLHSKACASGSGNGIFFKGVKVMP